MKNNARFFEIMIHFLFVTIFCFMSSLGHTKELSEFDSFTVIKDGVEYLCERKTPPDPLGNIRCRETAYKGPFSTEQAKQLCDYSYTELPALCGIEAYKGPFSLSEAITLCQYATNIGPSECAIKAYKGPFLKQESIELCKTKGTEMNADCAIKAYNSGFSKDEAIRVCKATRNISIPNAKGKPYKIILKSSIN